MTYTPKQLELMRMWQRNELRRINLLEGSVSSGKTWISLVLWAFWVAEMPQDKLYMMCAKSLTTLKRNCLILLQELVGESNFAFSLSAKEAYLFGRRILLEGANDIRSESKIRGLTLQGAYCDELTQFPKDFFAMLLSRLRLPGAKLMATTNPDAPTHWLKEEYIDRQDKLDFLNLKFTVDDNTTLPADYVQNLKLEYEGTIYYDRFILGLWKSASGLIYPMYQTGILKEKPSGSVLKRVISIDYGTMNAFAALSWAQYSDFWLAEKEYYYSGRDSGMTKTDEEYAQDLDRFTADLPKPIKVIIDPSAASFIALLQKRQHQYKVIKAENNVLDGIRETATAIQLGKVKYLETCRCLIREMQGYVWDDNAVEDRPVKVNDHACDALRYLCFTLHVAKPKTKPLAW